MQNLELILLSLFCGIATYAGLRNHANKNNYAKTQTSVNNEEWVKDRNKYAPYVTGILMVYIISFAKVVNGYAKATNTYVETAAAISIFGSVILIADCLVYLLASSKPKLPYYLARYSQLVFALANLSLVACLLGLLFV